jgi:hypothetical protein
MARVSYVIVFRQELAPEVQPASGVFYLGGDDDTYLALRC